MAIKRVRSDEARRTFRAILNEVEHQGVHVQVLRYDTPSAVLVPIDWYTAADECLMASRGAEAGSVQPPGGVRDGG